MQTIVSFLALMLVMLHGGSPQSAWSQFTSRPGAFSVSMPGTPTEHTQVVKTEVGSIDLHMFMIDRQTSAFMVGYSDYPSGLVKISKVEKILDGARDGCVKNVQGKLLSERRIGIAGYPGRELSIEAPGDAIIKNRLFMVKSRLYQVMSVMPKANAGSPEVGKFLSSFRLLSKSASR